MDHFSLTSDISRPLPNDMCFFSSEFTSPSSSYSSEACVAWVCNFPSCESMTIRPLQLSSRYSSSGVSFVHHHSPRTRRFFARMDSHAKEAQHGKPFHNRHSVQIYAL